MKTFSLRAALAALAAITLAVLAAAPASAHVTVNPNESSAGSYAKLTFRVPNESATASTVSLSVALPADHPIANVSVLPVPGWTAELSTQTLDPPITEGDFTFDEVTDAVTWTADDGVGVRPGEFMEFAISVGPLPPVDQLVLPATQTYSDGDVVTWGDVAALGVDAHSLDRPAPVVSLTPSGFEEAHSLTERSSSTDATAQLLGALGLAVGAAALVVAVIALKRKSRA